MRFPLLFLLLPLAEIAVFVMVGREIGVLATVGLVILAVVVGVVLLRIQGFGTLARLRRVMDEGGTPGRELVHGAMILLAALLLITPGFISDVFGILLFIPAVRETMWRFLRRRISVVSAHSTSGAQPRPRVIDLDSDDYNRN